MNMVIKFAVLLSAVVGAWGLFSAAHVLLDDVFGIGLAQVVLELMLLAVFSMVIATASLPFIWIWDRVRAVKARHAFCGMKTHTVYIIVTACVAGVLLPPHFWMSWKLSPLKRQFAAVCAEGPRGKHFTGFDPAGKSVYEYDYGGQLDALVQERGRLLRQHRFVPLHGYWKCTGGPWPLMVMPHIFTFLPDQTYRSIFGDS